MFEILAKWIVSAITIFLVARFVPGFSVNSFSTALVVALILGLINAFIKPVVLIFTLPINILTLGIFTFVINAIFLILVSKLVQGFVVNGFIPAFIGAILIWLIGLALNLVFPKKAL